MNLLFRNDLAVENFGNILTLTQPRGGTTSLIRSCLHSMIYNTMPGSVEYHCTYIHGLHAKDAYSDFEQNPFVHLYNWENRVEVLKQIVNSISSQLNDEYDESKELPKIKKEYLVIFDYFCTNGEEGKEFKDLLLTLTSLTMGYKNVHIWVTCFGLSNVYNYFPYHTFDVNTSLKTRDGDTKTLFDNRVDLDIEGRGIILIKNNRDKAIKVWRIPFLPKGKKIVEV